jgi:hypothetical protein
MPEGRHRFAGLRGLLDLAPDAGAAPVPGAVAGRGFMHQFSGIYRVIAGQTRSVDVPP